MNDGFTLTAVDGVRRPSVLSHSWPPMEASARSRVEATLRDGCTCEGISARLTKRKQVNGVMTVHLQCETCGRSMSGSLPRAAHFQWQDYREWDEALSEAYWARRTAENRAAVDARIGAIKAEGARARAEQAAEFARLQAEYAEWCRTSPEWHALAARVKRRAGFTCEACLAAPAVHVHHLTYRLGKLPPAWELRAVCKGCHDRLHADRHGREDDWCPRSKDAVS